MWGSIFQVSPATKNPGSPPAYIFHHLGQLGKHSVFKPTRKKQQDHPRMFCHHFLSGSTIDSSSIVKHPSRFDYKIIEFKEICQIHRFIWYICLGLIKWGDELNNWRQKFNNVRLKLQDKKARQNLLDRYAAFSFKI